MQKWIKIGLIGLGIVVSVALVFGAGFFIGRFTSRNAPPIVPLLERGFLGTGSHGATGAIEVIQDKTIILKVRDGTSRQIVTDSATRFERNLRKINLSDLKTGDRIIVVGTPDAQGILKARVIRIIDPRVPIPTPKSQ